MPVMDEFKEERAALKQKPLKKKIEHFWHYYKWHTIGTIVGAILLFILVRDITSNKDYGFFGIFVNAYPKYAETTAFDDAVAKALDIDLEEYEVAFDHNYRMTEEFNDNSFQTAQMLMVHTAAGDVDVMVMDTYNFSKYGYNNNYGDLRFYLSDDQLKALEGRIFYVDATLAEKIQEASQNMTLAESGLEYPANPYDYESMDNPIPVGISLTGCEKFEEYFVFHEDTEGFLGVFVGTKHPEEVSKFIDYLFDLNE